ncbi:MAG TPA: YcaO-like family protein [Devosia sp.]|nr:YcaO-like family protein [Devosia sp.]
MTLETASPRHFERTGDRSPVRYSDRVCAPADTLARIRPFFPELGITRLARQTGLDDIGIPCFSAIRPNARTLAANQGKGIDDDSAMTSAAMEALEYAVAEEPTVPRRRASIARLEREGIRFHWPERLLPAGTTRDEDREFTWVSGFDYFTGAPVLVPYDAVAIGQDELELPGITVSTNGLASGNTEPEAIFHALCELVERDASSLAALASDEALRRTQIRPEDFRDPVIDDLLARIRNAGCALTLFDLTTNLGVPVIQAVIFDDVAETQRHFDLSSGVGCHPVAIRAALRAITEAAQTRLTNIAGSRDDFHPAEYRFGLDPSLLVYRGSIAASRPVTPGCALGSSAATLSAFLAERLLARKINEVVVVPLGGERYGSAVVKVLAPRLEDKSSNINWRPGPRALSAMLRVS